MLSNILVDTVPFLYNNNYVNLNNAFATPAAVTQLINAFNINSIVNFNVTSY